MSNDVKVTVLPYDPSAENEAQVGRWKLMGDDVHDDTTPRKYGERFDDSDVDYSDIDDWDGWQADPATQQAMRDAAEYFPLDEQEDW